MRLMPHHLCFFLQSALIVLGQKRFTGKAGRRGQSLRLLNKQRLLDVVLAGSEVSMIQWSNEQRCFDSGWKDAKPASLWRAVAEHGIFRVCIRDDM